MAGAEQLVLNIVIRVDQNGDNITFYMLLSTIALALLSGSALAQFPFTGKHNAANCPAVNRAIDEATTIGIREPRSEGYRPRSDIIPS